MPRGFSDNEKENIRRNLIDCGRSSFGRLGIRKTSVDELARAAGISKGAFYNFFESKEDLYFAVIRDFETTVHEQIFEIMRMPEESEKKKLKRVMLEIFNRVGNEPFLQNLIAHKEYEYLRLRFTANQLSDALEADIDFSGKLIELWKSRGKLKIEDPEIVAGVFRALFFLLLHKQDIGEAHFSEVLGLMLEASIDKLITD